MEGSVIHKPEGDELFIHDSTLQHLIHAALTHPPLTPQPKLYPESEWTPLLRPILEGLQEPQHYEKAWEAFMHLIAQRPDFVHQSNRDQNPQLQKGLLNLHRRLTRTKAAPQHFVLMLLENEGFYHGAIQEEDSLLIFFYFASANTGLGLLMSQDQPTPWTVRFQILSDDVPSDLDSDSPTTWN